MMKRRNFKFGIVVSTGSALVRRKTSFKKKTKKLQLFQTFQINLPKAKHLAYRANTTLNKMFFYCLFFVLDVCVDEISLHDDGLPGRRQSHTDPKHEASWSG